MKLFLAKGINPFSNRFATVLFFLVSVSFAANAGSWTMSASQTNLPQGVPTVVTFTLKQTSPTTSSAAGSFTIAFPAGLTVSSPALVSASGKYWTIGQSAAYICLQAMDQAAANRLAVNETVVFSATITAAVAGNYGPFSTSRSQNSQNCNLGSGFAPTSSPVIHVGEAVLCTPVTDRIYVNAAAVPGGTGSSWTCAVQSLATAVATANANSAVKTIWVAAGAYSAGPTRSSALTITRADLKILGGFAGTETNAANANPVLNPTIISGDLGVTDDASDNNYHLIVVKFVPQSANGLEINGFTLEKGNANGAVGSGNNYGGALVFNTNNTGTAIDFKNCIFTQNNASVQGGAAYIDHSNVNFTRCSFISNTSANGGAVFGFFSSSKFTSSLFSKNTVSANGGAFYNNFGTPEFRKVVFTENNSVGDGGAVYLNQANGIVLNTVFNTNGARFGGGIYQHNASITTIGSSTFFNNTASYNGGALVVGSNNSQAGVANSVFFQNKKAGADNVALADVSNFSSAASAFANNILQANTIVPADNGTTVKGNLRGTNPLFVNAASPAGADLTWATSDDGLALSAASPAVNTGDNAAVALAGVTDYISGNTRIICSTVDIGAYENEDCGLLISRVATTEAAAAKKIDVTSSSVTNPFSSTLQVRYNGTEKCTLSVLDLSGRPMVSSRNIAQGVTSVNAGTWNRGMYEVVLNTASGKRMVYKAIKL